VIDKEKVSRAIWHADDMAAKPDFAWGDTTRASYRRMAEAATEAVIDQLPNPCGNDDCLANCSICVQFYDQL
jgi:hypothetical protein